ncbi:AraC family transcriptional regulator [Tissierella sp. MB52-C2]|uniref:AraC family transcriptional regulator n=1 Tax=Tissierella sp. MB52-C2 TaxID=3070999 RepID=UPI00280A7148|nr:AraC family transcriptional regulator [Tissierella sp. MB52-C2]WMM24638.1 AraC family transcriptional regulator [Tissierella sp. MB52-C2]
MVHLENQLLKEINCRNKAKTLYYYNRIFNNIKEFDFSDVNYIKSIKNYLISLSSILYINASNSPVCKKILYEKRVCMIKEIEKKPCVKDLYSLGKDLIFFHLDIQSMEDMKNKNPIIMEALDYIYSNLDENLTLGNVAKEIHISSSYLSCLFSKCTGYSFSDFINKIRIDKSKLLLQNTSLSLLDITIECGFSSQSYFCYVFKKVEGVTPKEYRTKLNTKK